MFSVVAAFATSAEMLIVSRALLGIAGATLMPSTLAPIGNMFRDPRQRATDRMGGGLVMVGIAAGPVVGGVLLEAFWWGSMFLLGAPLMLLLLVTAPLLPEYQDRDAGRLDLVSPFFSLAALLPLVYGLEEFARTGTGWAPVAAARHRPGRCGVPGPPAAPVQPSARCPNARRSRSLGPLAALTNGTVASGGAGFLFAQHVQPISGLSPLQAAFWTLPQELRSPDRSRSRWLCWRSCLRQRFCSTGATRWPE